VILPRVMTKYARNLALEIATPCFAYKSDLVLVPSHICLVIRRGTIERPIRSQEYLERFVLLSQSNDKVYENLTLEIATIYFAYTYNLVLVPSHIWVITRQGTIERSIRS
jgi:hypothetical protein